MSRPKERILNYELKTKNYELSNGPSVSLSKKALLKRVVIENLRLTVNNMKLRNEPIFQ